MGEVSRQKSVIQFSHICLARGQKFSKMVITQDGQGMGTNPFRLCLVSSSSRNWCISDSKRCVTLGDLPSSASLKFSHMEDYQFSVITLKTFWANLENFMIG